MGLKIFLGRFFKNKKKLSRTGRIAYWNRTRSVQFFAFEHFNEKSTKKHSQKIAVIENCQYLINYGFGYVVRNYVTHELRYFQASGRTDRALTSLCLISCSEELMGFLL